MKKQLIEKTGLLSLFVLLVLALASPALAQTDQALTLKLNRDFGYGGFGEIQGLFTMKVTAPESVQRVEFFIDDQKMGEAAKKPFTLQFTTDSYPIGTHTLRAAGSTAGGETLASNEITTKFVSAEAGWQAALKLVGPLLGAVVLILVLSVLFTTITGKKRLSPALGTQRRYGGAGGAICPKCHRPTPLHIFGFNLLFYKFDRCDNCGKWSAMRIVPLAQLRQAEAAELEQARHDQTAVFSAEESPEEKLKKELERSKFLDQ